MTSTRIRREWSENLSCLAFGPKTISGCDCVASFEVGLERGLPRSELLEATGSESAPVVEVGDRSGRPRCVLVIPSRGRARGRITRGGIRIGLLWLVPSGNPRSLSVGGPRFSLIRAYHGKDANRGRFPKRDPSHDYGVPTPAPAPFPVTATVANAEPAAALPSRSTMMSLSVSGST